MWDSFSNTNDVIEDIVGLPLDTLSALRQLAERIDNYGIVYNMANTKFEHEGELRWCLYTIGKHLQFRGNHLDWYKKSKTVPTHTVSSLEFLEVSLLWLDKLIVELGQHFQWDTIPVARVQYWVDVGCTHKDVFIENT